MTVHIIDGLQVDVDRGPNWLFVRLRSRSKSFKQVPQIADQLWSISSRHFIYRLVLELDELDTMPPGLIGQLVMLQERLSQCGGSLKICGLSDDCVETLQDSHVNMALPNHPTREQAVLGHDALDQPEDEIAHTERSNSPVEYSW